MFSRFSSSSRLALALPELKWQSMLGKLPSSLRLLKWFKFSGRSIKSLATESLLGPMKQLVSSSYYAKSPRTVSRSSSVVAPPSGIITALFTSSDDTFFSL